MIDPFITFIVSLFALVVFAGFFCTLVHELGHALPLLLMTKGKISIYIGSYGDQKNCIKIPLGRLEIWLKYNPLRWFNGGLCVSPREGILSWKQKLLYVSMGPLASLLLSAVCCYILLLLNDKEYVYISIAWLFLIISLVGAISSLAPRQMPKYSSSGWPLYSDGYNILLLLKQRKLPADYDRAMKLFNNKNYSEAAALLDTLLSKNVKNPYIYRGAISANLFAKNYVRASEINDIFFEKYPVDADDYCNAGVIDSRTNKHTDALNKFQKSLELNPNHFYTLNNLGYTLCLFERYDEATAHLNKAISLMPAFADTYNNRGYAKMKTGKMEEGLQDIMYSLELDDQNACAYANLGIYHFLRNELDEAESLFKKSMAMEEEINFLAPYLNDIQQHKNIYLSQEMPDSASNSL